MKTLVAHLTFRRHGTPPSLRIAHALLDAPEKADRYFVAIRRAAGVGKPPFIDGGAGKLRVANSGTNPWRFYPNQLVLCIN